MFPGAEKGIPVLGQRKDIYVLVSREDKGDIPRWGWDVSIKADKNIP